MIAVNDNVLAAHLHKSGGTFINKLLNQHPDIKTTRLGYHATYEDVVNTNPNLSSLKVIGTVRHPIEFYVSLYHFQAQSPRPNYVFNAFSNNGTLSLEETITNMIQPPSTVFDQMLQHAPQFYNGGGANITKNQIVNMQDNECGWYTHLFNRLYKGIEEENLVIVRTDEISEKYASTLAKLTDVPTDLESQFRSSPKANTSKHDAAISYFTEDMIELVNKQDKEIIQTYFG